MERRRLDRAGARNMRDVKDCLEWNVVASTVQVGRSVGTRHVVLALGHSRVCVCVPRKDDVSAPLPAERNRRDGPAQPEYSFARVGGASTNPGCALEAIGGEKFVFSFLRSSRLAASGGGGGKTAVTSES